MFERQQLNGMVLRNRFVRSATYEAMATAEGGVTDPLLAVMERLAAGGVGLIISGHTYVARCGQAGVRQLGVCADEQVEGLKAIPAVIHRHGGAVALQLAHAGRWAIGTGRDAPRGPSDWYGGPEKKATAMTQEEINETITAFGKAAARAVEAGFDAVEIHAAHSYLLSQFLSPRYNQRKDEYGGALENRSRFLLAVYDEIRARVGAHFPVLVKINSEDFLDDGFSREDMVQVCSTLEARGIDAVELSGGTFDSGRRNPSRVGVAKDEAREGYHREGARLFKQSLQVPLILVGGNLSLSCAEKVVQSGEADYIALSRALICEPELIKRWAAGDRSKAACISCNRCFKTLATEQALHCAAQNR